MESTETSIALSSPISAAVRLGGRRMALAVAAASAVSPKVRESMSGELKGVGKCICQEEEAEENRSNAKISGQRRVAQLARRSRSAPRHAIT
jgi:hypothetical protein